MGRRHLGRHVKALAARLGGGRWGNGLALHISNKNTVEINVLTLQKILELY